MANEIQIINPIECSGWDELVLSTPEYSIFHTSSWARILCDSYHYTPHYFTVFNQKEIIFSLPFMEIKSYITGNRGVSLPFSDYCDPIIRQEENLSGILEEVTKYAKDAGWKYFEIRLTHDQLKETIIYKIYFRHILQLAPNLDTIWESLRDSTRRNINKAISSGVTIKISNSFEDLMEYYRLHCITRKYHGLPPQPLKFFISIYQHLIVCRMGIIILAKHKNKSVAGNIYFHVGKKAYFKYGASDRKYQQYRASNLVMWEAIQHYHSNSYASLCFGRTDIEDRGLLQYKNGWGTESSIIRYHKYDTLQGHFLNSKSTNKHTMSKVCKCLPLGVLHLIGSLCYRHIG